MARRLVAVLLAVPLVLAIGTGCSREVSSGHVEDKLSDGYTKATGHRPRQVHCPSDLPGKVGASERCTVVGYDGVTKTYTVTMTEIHGSKYNVHVQEVR